MRSDHKDLMCAVYTRKSSEEGLEQAFNSLDAQREACEAYIASQRHEGWRLVPKQYNDGGFSGGNMERPALEELMADIKAGKVSVVVVYKVDRLTRSLADFAKLVELFDAYGVSFVSVTQQFNTTTSMGRLTLNVLLSFAQFEREVTGERIRDKIAASKRKGMFMGGGYPLGYDLQDHQLVINEVEAEQVRTIFALYLELKCVRRMEAELIKRAIYSKRRVSGTGRATGGTRLGRGHLYYILKNRTYLGEIVHKGQIYEGRHSAIIARSTWDEVQALLNKNGNDRASGQKANHTSLLAGLLFDDRGNKLTPSHTQKGAVRYRYYVSWAVVQNQLDRLGSIKRVPAEEIESLVVDQVRDLCSSDENLRRELSRLELDLDAQQALIGDIRRYTAKFEGETAWTDLTRVIVQKVIVGPTQVKVTVDLQKAIAALESDTPTGLPGVSATRPLIVDLIVAVRVTRSGRQKSMITLDSDGAHRLINANLVLAVARATKWDREIRAGGALSELARRDGVSTTYATRIMPLAFLAPDIVQAIYEGRQPLGLKVKAASANLPLDWAAQRRVLGFPAR
ncbi:MAG: recombinase family protein [Proteobacteria bacterium]|nr:recombinase family protein [Pseudomonadota bacterium]